MGTKSATAVDHELARIASRAHGVVTRAQLLEAGITSRQIVGRVQSGSLHPVHAGVYRVGHRAPSTEALYMAAVLACGEEALLAGRAAGHLLGIVKGRPPPPEVVAAKRRIVKGVRTRRGPVDHATTCRGIPVTNPPRTLVDLARDLPEQDLARACHEAGVRFNTTPAMVEAVLECRPNSPGASKLRAILRGDVPVALSKLEAASVSLFRSAGFDLPAANRPAGGRRVDFRWPEHKLTVEIDSYTYHGSRHAWERDRRREREAYARGDQFRRYTWGDVFEQPELMLAELRALLLT
jgi:Transcriptional regulator, AbiEi antitoxin